jgi:hypothetical protein
MKILALIAASLFFLEPSFAQTKAARPITVDPDRLTLTCAQILQKSSSDWILYFIDKTGQTSGDNQAATIRALGSYGKCYEERTSHLAAALGKGGKGPLMGANGNFRDFQKALDDFTAKALAATNKSPGSQKAAYAALYEKQFRYQFYESYTQKGLLTRSLTPQESDDYAKAKNHFGEVIGLLPDETLHPVHAAFRQIFDAGPVSDVTKLELYRFAIFLLSPAKDKPFSAPPF